MRMNVYPVMEYDIIKPSIHHPHKNLKISSSKTHPWIPSIFNKILHLQKKKITNSTTADSDIPVLILMNINVSMLDLDKK